MQLMKMMMVTAFLMMKIRMMMEMARRMNSKLFQFYLYACPKIPDLSINKPSFVVKLRQGSGKERQGKARMAKGERP